LEARQDAVEEAQDAQAGRLSAVEARQAVSEEMQDALGEYLVETKERVAHLEGRAARQPGAAKRQTRASHAPPDGPVLSKDHLYQAYALAHQERSRTSERVDTLLRELAEAFGVEDISDLPDALWEEARTWFWQRAQRG